MSFFARTNYDGNPIGDTSNMFGHPNDFVYDYDRTCGDQDTRGRRKTMQYIMFEIFLVLLKFLFKL